MGQKVAGALARKVHLPSKHMVSVKMLCLLGWLDVFDRDSGAKAFLPPPPGDASARPLPQSALTITNGT